MTTTTPSIERRFPEWPDARGAFTLTEVMVAAVLTVLVLAGVLSTFLLIGRTGYNSSAYSATEAEVRRGLESFAEDVRQASDIHWTSGQCITLTVPTATNATQLVTYAYDEDSGSGTYQCFYRQPGPADSTGPRQVLMHGVADDFAFHRYKLEQAGVADNAATNDLETKQIQLNLRAVHIGRTTVATTQTAVSARFVLRNKRVSD
jgi:type II secretory pathway pseudopilin PulG